MVYSKGGGDAFTITVMVRAGSIHEPARLAGISHLLEHLLFKSQKRRINETVREHGAFINAATGKDWTRYHVSCAPDQYARFVDLLYDVVFVFAIDGEDVENEKRIVLQEKNETQNLITDILVDESFAGTPYEKSVIGNKKTVCAVTLEDLETYHRQRYLDGGCVVAASCPQGATKKYVDDVADRVARKFESAGLPVPDPCYDHLRGRDDLLSGSRECAHFGTCEDEDEDENDKHPHEQHEQHARRCKSIAFSDAHGLGASTGLNVTFRARPYDRRTYVVTQLVTEILAGSLESPWFQKIREKKFQVYQLHLQTDIVFGGAAIVSLRCVSESRILAVFDTVAEMVRQTVRDGLFTKNSSDFSALKRAFKTKQRLTHSSPLSVLNRLALDAFYTSARVKYGVNGAGETSSMFRTFDDLLDEIDAVTREEVDGIAREMFSHPLVVVLGNNDASMRPEKFEKHAHTAVEKLTTGLLTEMRHKEKERKTKTETDQSQQQQKKQQQRHGSFVTVVTTTV
jgi:predicted Zn-dependent peptidase